MKTAKMLTILVLALGLILCQARVSEAAPMGTAFTYQGHLYDANIVANDIYDFQFKLYDANTAGNQVGGDVNKPDVDVIDGYFTLELDFGGDVFDGNAVWLETGVRPGELEDPNVYTILEPRLELTATPYALTTSYSLNTRGIYVDDSNNVSISNISVSGDLSFTDMLNTMYFNSDGVINVGRELSMTSGTTMELVSGAAMNLQSGAAMNLQSGAAMNLQSSAPMTIITPALNVNAPIDMGDAVTIAGNVGIGTTNPGTKLDVQGGDINTSGKIKEGGNNLIPSGAVMFFNLSSCPCGWSEVTTARGRYLVGKPSGGTLAGTKGTALTNLENRAVGKHSHGVTDPGHYHHFQANSGLWQGAETGTTRYLPDSSGDLMTEAQFTGITVDDSGGVEGTNAPYIQLLVCQKD